MLKSLVALLCLVAALAAPLFAQQQLATPATRPGAADAQSESARSSEVAILRAELAAIKSHDEKLLATVHWALGTVIAVLLVMAGFGWYANFRLYERDKIAIRAELEVNLSERWKELSEKLDRALKEHATEAKSAQDKLALETESHIKKLKESLDQSFKSSQQSTLQLIRDSRLEFVEFVSDMKAESTDYIAYKTHLSLLHLALEKQWESKASKALDRILKYLQSREEFWYDDIVDLKEVAEKLPPSVAPYKNLVLSQLARLKPRRAGR